MSIKSRKLFAILVMTAMILTMLPLTAFAQPAYGVTHVAIDAEDVETGDNVKFTLTFYDYNGNPLPNASTFKFVARSSRGAETITQFVYDDEKGYVAMDKQKGKINGITKDNPFIDILSSKTGKELTVNELTGGQLTFLVSSSFTGDVTLYFYEPAYDSNGNLDPDEYIEFAKKTVTFSPSKVSAANSSFDRGGTTENLSLFANLKLEAEVRDSANKLVRDEEVTFQKRFESGAWTTITTKKTNSLGKASINTTESEAGKYEYRARVGTTTLGNPSVKVDGKTTNQQILTVNWAGTRAAKIEAVTEADKIAIDEEFTIEFKVTDAFGNGVNGQAVKFEVDSRPTGARSKTETLVPGPTTNDSWKDGVVKFKYTPNRGGDYTFKATVLDGPNTGDAATGLTQKFNCTAVEFGEVERIVLKLAKDRVSIKSDWDLIDYVAGTGSLDVGDGDAIPAGNWMKMAVDMYDENDVKSTNIEDKIRLATSNPSLASIDPYGVEPMAVVATSREDRRGVVTITATHTDTGNTATVELPVVGEPSSIDTNVAVSSLVATVDMQFVDADGNNTWDSMNKDTGFAVIAPSGVSVSHREDFKKGKGSGSFRATAEEAGTYNLTVVSNNGLSTTFPVTFGEDAAPGAAANVVMFIGSNSFVQDGQPGSMDVAPFIEDGRTFVPVRFIAEAFGAEVDWEPKDAATEKVFVTSGDIEITITIGEYTIEVVSGDETETVVSDVAAFIRDGRTFLPLRAIGEILGAEFDWGPKDADTKWVSFGM